MSIRIFIADDHTVLREGLAHLLALQPDFEVVGSAADGREAVAQCIRLAPDVVVLDIHMPDTNGIEAARQLQSRLPAAGVIVLSMHASREHVVHALEAGARAYLQKESAAREVVEAVRAVHAGRRYLSPRIAALLAEHVTSGGPASSLRLLSRREREILQLVAQGCTSAAIGERLNLSPKTVDTYRSRLMTKLGLADVTGIVKFALREGLITLD